MNSQLNKGGSRESRDKDEIKVQNLNLMMNLNAEAFIGWVVLGFYNFNLFFFDV